MSGNHHSSLLLSHIHWAGTLVCCQVNQEELKGLLPRQGFRMDGRQFAASADTARHASASDYSIFVASVQGKTVTKLVEIFKANAQTNVNLRAAGNAMLLLNKIKPVGPVVVLM